VSWVFERFHNQIDEDIRILHTTYFDNAFLSKRYVDTLLKLKNTNYAYYKIYCLGEFGTLGKQIFTNYRIEDLSNFDMSNIHVGIGLDFGFVNDPTAIGLFGYDRINKKIYIFDEIYKTNMLTDEIYNSIVGKQWHKLNIVADSAEPRTIRELQIKGLKIVPAQKGRDSIIHGLTWLQQQEIIIHKDCKNAIEEIANYTYKKDKKTGLYLNEPIDEYNHLAGDSLRYYSEKFSMTGQPVGNIKKVLGL
jgi:phage terminase large subunit